MNVDGTYDPETYEWLLSHNWVASIWPNLYFWEARSLLMTRNYVLMKETGVRLIFKF